MTTVVVLGGYGMLGGMLLGEISRWAGIELRATVRDQAVVGGGRRPGGGATRWSELDAESADAAQIEAVLRGADWAINAIGVIKPYVKDDNSQQVQRATRVNGLFPHLLASAAARTGTQVLQIATDCVYSGTRSGYQEPSLHDALDVYGKTKSLGEVHSPFVHHLRCSIIGPELKSHLSLLDWLLMQPQGAQLNGYANHVWNGVTTLHFARLCGGIVRDGIRLPHLQHVVPANRVTKLELLRVLAGSYHRDDLTVRESEAPIAVDRTLGTVDPVTNNRLWAAAGYPSAPTVEQMVQELARYGAADEAQP
jgi:dTDP-4-dehydrorhamnose reductase